MRKTQKKIFGFLGLLLVVAMTFFAATLPGPKASAISSLTDTITVRVISETPDIRISNPKSGSVFIYGGDKDLEFTYEQVNTITVDVEYTNANNETKTVRVLEDYYVGGAVGSMGLPIDVSSPEFGFGEYVVRVTGRGEISADTELISFSYYPVIVDTDEDEKTGDVVVDLEYDPDDGTDDSTGDVAEIIINVYDEDGNLVKELSPIKVTPPTTKVTIPFDKYDLPSGTYTIETTAYNRAGDKLWKTLSTYVIYKATPSIPVPDTGGMMGGLNISKTDYLITGLIVFSMVGIGGLMFIAKRDKKTNRKRR